MWKPFGTVRLELQGQQKKVVRAGWCQFKECCPHQAKADRFYAEHNRMGSKMNQSVLQQISLAIEHKLNCLQSYFWPHVYNFDELVPLWTFTPPGP